VVTEIVESTKYRVEKLFCSETSSRYEVARLAELQEKSRTTG
jgi:hypothetical protein